VLAVSLVPNSLGVESRGYSLFAWICGLGFLVPTLLFAVRRSDASARRVLLASVIYLPAILTAMVVSYLPVA